MPTPKKKPGPGRPARPAEKAVRITITVPPEVAAWAEGLYDNYNRHRAVRTIILREYELHQQNKEAANRKRT